MARKAESSNRLDDAAAQAGSIMSPAGTQDEIASVMGIRAIGATSRVACHGRAADQGAPGPSDRRCLEMAARLKEKYDLKHVDVVPSDPGSQSTTVGIAEAGAAEIERWLKSAEPVVLAIGTGRTLKATNRPAAIDGMPAAPYRFAHGNIRLDGSAAYYNVIFSMADTIKARHFPCPCRSRLLAGRARSPAQAEPGADRPELAPRPTPLRGRRRTGADAPLCEDGFLARDEMARLMAAGAAGEICGWMFDTKACSCPTASMSASPRFRCRGATARRSSGSPRAGANTRRCAPALKGRIINGLVTDEATADYLLRV